MNLLANAKIYKRLKALRAANPSDRRIARCLRIVKREDKWSQLAMHQDFTNLPLRCRLSTVQEYDNVWYFQIACTGTPDYSTPLIGPYRDLESIFEYGFQSETGWVMYNDIAEAIGLV